MLWVLKRARIGGLGYCSGLATAALRWRRHGGSGSGEGAWHGLGAPARGRRAVGRLRGDAWVPARSKGEVGVGRGGGGRRGAVRRRGKQSRQAGEEDRDLNAISKNFRGITIKQG